MPTPTGTAEEDMSSITRDTAPSHPDGARPAASVPDFVREVARDAALRLRPQRVILFGSRARGDAAPNSDYDLAIDAPGLPEKEWARFVLDARESFGALLPLDLMRLDEAPPELREHVEREGIELYVRRQ